MKRILIIGPGGSGKSTLARALGEKLGLEVLHLDKFYWSSGWIKQAPDDWQKTVSQFWREMRGSLMETTPAHCHNESRRATRLCFSTFRLLFACGE